MVRASKASPRGDASGRQDASRAPGAQMIPAGAKTGVTQSDSAISQPQDRGVQMLSWSSPGCGGFPRKSWTVFLREGDTAESSSSWNAAG